MSHSLTTIRNTFCQYDEAHLGLWKEYLEKRSVKESICVGGSLLDLLYTGCPLPRCYSTRREWTPEIENYILFLIENDPATMGFCLGQMRCRDWVTPLVVECSNIKVPLYIIENILQNGAKPNTFLNLNCQPIHIIDELEKY